MTRARSQRLFLALLLLPLMAAGLLARNNPRVTRSTGIQDRIDPRRRPVNRPRVSEFQPVNHFVPRSLSAPLPRRRTFWHASGRNAQIDRSGNSDFNGGLRFHNNRVLRDRRTSFRPRR